MKVAMVTPMARESAIADVMMQAVPDLAVDWELDVWSPDESARRPCPVPVIPFSADASVAEALSVYDLVVYVLGDSPLHSRILPLAQRVPGLVVLHDASMTNLVRRTAVETGTLDELVDRIRAQSGDRVAEIVLEPSLAPGGDGWLRLCEELPFDDLVLEGSLGAVVHSAWHGKRVDGLTLGDVTVAPLPVPSARGGRDSSHNPDAERRLSDLPDDALLLVTVGAMNANRRVDLLLEAISGDPALQNVHLWAVGPAEGTIVGEIAATARRLDISDRFASTGRVSDQLLTQILARADMAAALRDPVLEGQSASVLTQLLSGTPLIVFDIAHYAELPDDVAIKVAPAAGTEGLRQAIRTLAADPQQRERRGEAGRDHVLNTRSGSAYAAAILEAGERALAAKPRLHLGTDLARRLQRLGLDQEPAVVAAATDVAFDLFDLA